jgi:hypothetical protein
VLLIDDASVLVDLGVPFPTVLGFIRQCRTMVRGRSNTSSSGGGDGEAGGGSNGLLVVLCHREWEDDEAVAAGERGVVATETLSAYLPHLADIRLSVERLKSGYSKDVHGQLVVTRTSPTAGTPKQIALHYQIGGNGAEFFAPGTSKAVL